ncbi:MAG: hypothetical protein RLY97_750 [Pseudomonadota bacterium]|jgi:1-acyl-sn-glycerol-3-phosphate acyltransferase
MGRGLAYENGFMKIIDGKLHLSWATRWVHDALIGLFKRQGWQLFGQAPGVDKCILLGAPHTSNWDFLFFLGVCAHFGIRPRFMGKDSLFRWPMTRFMREMGGVAVVRSSSQNYVDQMVAAFAAEDNFSLVVAPEGTRKMVREWRSGFYHIAVGAGVPVVCGWVDLPRKRGGLSQPIAMCGDFKVDLAKIADFYRSVLPDHPKLAILHRMVEGMIAI